MNRIQDHPLHINHPDYRSLEAEDLAAIFRDEHDWTQFYNLLNITGIRCDDAAMLTYMNLSRERNMIGFLNKATLRLEEESIPQKLLEELQWDLPLTEPLFPRLYADPPPQYLIDPEQTGIHAAQLHENLKEPSEFLEILLVGEGRPSAPLISFRITFLRKLESVDDRLPNQMAISKSQLLREWNPSHEGLWE